MIGGLRRRLALGQRIRRLRQDGLGPSLRRARDRFDKLDAVQFGLRGAIVPFRVSHRSGPRTPGPPDAPVVLCLVRNGMPWVRSFLAHHRALGFRHFVILDNGSTDGTLDSLAAEPDVTLLTSRAPYSAYENTMKRYLADRYGRDRWCLFVDIDEQFDFPHSDRIGLADFIAYLETRRFDAVITQMLDMFSDQPLSACRIDDRDRLTDMFPFYELAHIRKTEYGFAETAPIRMHWGGIRKAVFGTDNGLTKVSFFRNVKGLRPFIQWHHIGAGRIADLSAVLFHYPFVDSFADKVSDAVLTGRYGYKTSDEYSAYERMTARADFRMMSDAAVRFTGTADLVAQDFLVTPPGYEAFVAAAARRSGPAA